MSLVLRISLIFIVLGVFAGLMVRGLVSLGRLPLLLGASAAPWLVHVLYILSRVGTESVRGEAVVFVLVSLLLAAGVFWFSLRVVKRRPGFAAAFPLLLAGLYGFIPLLWFFYRLRGAGVVLDSIPNVWLFWTSLLMSAGLWAFTFGARPPKSGGLLRRRP